MEGTFAKPKRTNSNLSMLSKRLKRPRHDSDGDDGVGDSDRNTPASITHLPPEAYRVGWICALSIERAVAEAMLDEEHGPLPAQPRRDSNSYTLGRIGLHNVVTASLPAGHFGSNNATTVANNMLWSFRRIDQRLGVGIGGGAPDVKDIRLGDVVVSSQVVQYDLAKALPDGNFQITSVPTRPPQILLNTVATLQAKYSRLQS
jgi:nucleoside phosphorylase